jgi:hypothetical protein
VEAAPVQPAQPRCMGLLACLLAPLVPRSLQLRRRFHGWGKSGPTNGVVSVPSRSCTLWGRQKRCDPHPSYPIFLSMLPSP